MKKKAYLVSSNFNLDRIKQIKIWVYLDDDYYNYRRILDQASKGNDVKSISYQFQEYYSFCKEKLLDCLGESSSHIPKSVWWSGQVASHTSTGSNVMRNCVYALFIKSALTEIESDVVIICNDLGLEKLVKQILKKKGYRIYNKISIFKKMSNYPIMILKKVFFILLFFIEFGKIKYRKKHQSLKDIKTEKNIFIRSWMTQGNIMGSTGYYDRNFGNLGDFIKQRGYNPVFIPMFFNIGSSFSEQFKKMSQTDGRFLIPQQVLSPLDCFRLIIIELRRICGKLTKTKICDIDITNLLKYEIWKTSFNKDLLSLNLILPLLEKLRKKNINICRFIYPFENNTPEKTLILAQRLFFPKSTIVGFQHTVVSSGQLGIELGKNEYLRHPLPDKIICSGEIYKSILLKNNFPEKLLVNGPSLRFNHIRKYSKSNEENESDEQLKFVIVLYFSMNLSIELIDKVAKAAESFDCQILVKPHPMLEKRKIFKFIKEKKYKNTYLVDISCQELFTNGDIAFGITSITQLEAIACGIPLIRIVPELSFYIDPVGWLNYPIETSTSLVDIRKNIERALILEDRTLEHMSTIVREKCFSPLTDQLLNEFIV